MNTQYNYNADNTLQKLVNRHGSGTIISQHDYTYDGVGNRNSHNELINGTTNPYTYAYDALNRLTAVTNTQSGAVESYGYDPLGNRRTRTAGGTTLDYVYDSANQLTEVKQSATRTAGFVYDNNGSLTKKCESGTVTVSPTDCAGSTVSDLTHDALNRLTQVSKTGIPNEVYKYDDQGNRIQKTVGGAITNFLYNGPDIIGQYTSTWGTASAILTHGPGMDDPIMRVAGTTVQYYHQDGLGSVVSTTNQSGTTDGTARYDTWGNRIASTGTIPQYGYTGREPDDTGLIYYRARFYDPSIGRFTQRDPIGFQAGINRYAYVGGNPLNYNDPQGLLPESPIFADASKFYFNSSMSDADPSYSGLLKTATDYSSGVGDWLSGGFMNSFGLLEKTFGEKAVPITQFARQLLGTDTVVDKSSTAYSAGEYTGAGIMTSLFWSVGLNGGATTVPWSGYKEGALDIARTLGTTIDKTPIGATLSYLNYNVGIPFLQPLWWLASAAFAGNATGTVQAVIRNPGSVWTWIEKPILLFRGIEIVYK